MPTSITRRRKSKPYDPAAPQAHDRQATNLGVKVMVAPMLVPDPYEAGAQIVVVRNLRDDPLGERHARGTIDEAQYRAGRDYQRDFEQAGGGSVRAIDFTREAVDGGLRDYGVSDARIQATDRLGAAHVALGLLGTSIAQDVLVSGYSVATIAARWGHATKEQENYIGRRFRECLNTLAVVYNYAGKPK
jgi:hypothetical protein